MFVASGVTTSIPEILPPNRRRQQEERKRFVMFSRAKCSFKTSSRAWNFKEVLEEIFCDETTVKSFQFMIQNPFLIRIQKKT
jgi:hypothetical protein